MKFSKNFNNKKPATKLIFFNEKKIEKDLDNFWRGKLTLKVTNWQFSITWFRAGVDLPENFSFEKVLFFTQLSYHLMWSCWKNLTCYLVSTAFALKFGRCLRCLIKSFLWQQVHPSKVMRFCIEWEQQTFCSTFCFCSGKSTEVIQ